MVRELGAQWPIAGIGARSRVIKRVGAQRLSDVRSPGGLRNPYWSRTWVAAFPHWEPSLLEHTGRNDTVLGPGVIIMHHSRLCALQIDCRVSDLDEAAQFWAEEI